MSCWSGTKSSSWNLLYSTFTFQYHSRILCGHRVLHFRLISDQEGSWVVLFWFVRNAQCVQGESNSSIHPLISFFFRCYLHLSWYFFGMNYLLMNCRKLKDYWYHRWLGGGVGKPLGTKSSSWGVGGSPASRSIHEVAAIFVPARQCTSSTRRLLVKIHLGEILVLIILNLLVIHTFTDKTTK